jgi:PucR C-terminal helix-turn-helix domain/GGDEF-like domain
MRNGTALDAAGQDSQLREMIAGLHAVVLLGSFMHSSPRQQDTAELAAGGLAAIARVPLAAVAWYPQGTAEPPRLAGRYAGEHAIPSWLETILVQLCSRLHVFRPTRLEESQLPGRLRVAGVHVLLALPLRVSTECLGFLLVGGAAESFSTDLTLVQALGAQTSTALFVARTQELRADQMREQASLMAVLSEQGELLARAQRLQEDLIDLVLKGRDVGEIVKHLAGQLSAPLWLLDPEGHSVTHAPGGAAAVPPLPRRAELRRVLRALNQDEDPHPVEVITTGGARSYLVQTVATDQDLFGYLLVGSAPLDPLHRTVLQGGRLVLAMRLLIERSVAEAEERSGRDLLHEVLFGGARHGSAALAARLGYERDGPASVLAVRLRPVSSSADEGSYRARKRAVSAVQQELRNGTRGLAGIVDDDLIAIVRPETAGACARRILDRVASGAFGLLAAAGISDTCGSLADLPDARRQADMAAALAEDLGQGVLRFADLGLYRLLFDVQHADRVEEHVERWLGPLLRYDVAHHTQLVDTLAQFLAGATRLEDVARSLSIHMSTLKYRLRRIREILGFDFAHPPYRFEVELALRLKEVVKRLRADASGPVALS